MTVKTTIFSNFARRVFGSFKDKVNTATLCTLSAFQLP